MKKIIVPSIIFSTTTIVFQSLSLYQIFSHDNWIIKISFLIFLLTLFFLLLRWIKKKYYQNGISFKQAFVNGMLIGALSSIILAAYLFVFLSYIDPYRVNIQKMNWERTKQAAVDIQGPSAENEYGKIPIQQLLTPAGQALRALSTNIVYLIISLICAAILKTKTLDEIELSDPETS